ncbi:colorectal cancer-associated protein 2 [Varanus komodoensis]|uniref:colorectal cancer-associated protein 2 n=1 Tax=Varanus komodoensis TaxID=61221 RepID=UPI001CF77116|nr:colorectal cancer-associated protein 2 [Varanus komodoensis]
MCVCIYICNRTISGKPKIYQGVRVKITVKELLQQRRAKQAVMADDTGSESPDTSDPSGLLDYSYSPPQLPPFAPLSYGSPSPPEARSCMFAPSDGGPFAPDCHGLYPPASPTCCCPSCGSQHLDMLRVPEYFPSTTVDCMDYAPSVSAADDFFRRDRSWHSCCS